METADCPYGAGDCPKIEKLEDDVSVIEKTMNRILRILYLVAGILMVELGVVVV